MSALGVKSSVPTANRHRLPNPDRAIVDLAKLRDYCLNPNHEDGKHKARVFASALGIRQSDAEWLRKLLLLAARGEEASIVDENRFGTLYVLDFIRQDFFWLSGHAQRLDRTILRGFPAANNLLR